MDHDIRVVTDKEVYLLVSPAVSESETQTRFQQWLRTGGGAAPALLDAVSILGIEDILLPMSVTSVESWGNWHLLRGNFRGIEFEREQRQYEQELRAYQAREAEQKEARARGETYHLPPPPRLPEREDYYEYTQEHGAYTTSFKGILRGFGAAALGAAGPYLDDVAAALDQLLRNKFPSAIPAATAPGPLDRDELNRLIDDYVADRGIDWLKDHARAYERAKTLEISDVNYRRECNIVFLPARLVEYELNDRRHVAVCDAIRNEYIIGARPALAPAPAAPSVSAPPPPVAARPVAPADAPAPKGNFKLIGGAVAASVLVIAGAALMLHGGTRHTASAPPPAPAAVAQPPQTTPPVAAASQVAAAQAAAQAAQDAAEKAVAQAQAQAAAAQAAEKAAQQAAQQLAAEQQAQQQAIQEAAKQAAAAQAAQDAAAMQAATAHAAQLAAQTQAAQDAAAAKAAQEAAAAKAAQQAAEQAAARAAAQEAAQQAAAEQAAAAQAAAREQAQQAQQAVQAEQAAAAAAAQAVENAEAAKAAKQAAAKAQAKAKAPSASTAAASTPPVSTADALTAAANPAPALPQPVPAPPPPASAKPAVTPPAPPASAAHGGNDIAYYELGIEAEKTGDYTQARSDFMLSMQHSASNSPPALCSPRHHETYQPAQCHGIVLPASAARALATLPAD